MNLRVPPIRSKAIRRAARGQRCTLNLPGICNYDSETVVLAHIRDDHFGRSQKASDTSGMFCCSACHAAYDLARTGLDELSLLRLVFRAYQRTIERLVRLKVLLCDEDVKPTFAAKPVKPRKPKAQRAKVRPSRSMQSRNDLRKKVTL